MCGLSLERSRPSARRLQRQGALRETAKLCCVRCKSLKIPVPTQVIDNQGQLPEPAFMTCRAQGPEGFRLKQKRIQ